MSDLAKLPDGVLEMLKLADLEAAVLRSGRWGVFYKEDSGEGVILRASADYARFARAARYLVESRDAPRLP